MNAFDKCNYSNMKPRLQDLAVEEAERCSSLVSSYMSTLYMSVKGRRKKVVTGKPSILIGVD